MPKIYIIINGDGEYSGRTEIPVRAFTHKDVAQATMVKLDRIASQVAELRKTSFIVALKKTEAEYSALGFDVNYDSDWCLEEVELDERTEL